MNANPWDNGGPPLDDDDNVWGPEGWVAIGRALRSHHLVGFGHQVTPADDTRGFCFSKAEAWIDLIMECRYQPGTVMNKGRRMEIKPGQLLGAISWLGSRWNWTPKTVRRFIDRLEEEDMISRQIDEYGGTPSNKIVDSPVPDLVQPWFHPETDNGKQKGNQANVITICKYSLYQMPALQEGQAEGLDEGQARGKPGASQGQHLNKGTKEQGSEEGATHLSAEDPADLDFDAPEKSSGRYSLEFEIFWKAYPETRGMSKAKAWTAWKGLSRIDQQAAVVAIPAHKANVAKMRESNPRLTMLHAQGYLNQRRFETLIETPAAKGPWWKNPMKVAEITLDRWRAGIKAKANGIWPINALGPPPGQPECVVPQVLIDEFQLLGAYDANGMALRPSMFIH